MASTGGFCNVTEVRHALTEHVIRTVLERGASQLLGVNLHCLREGPPVGGTALSVLPTLTAKATRPLRGDRRAGDQGPYDFDPGKGRYGSPRSTKGSLGSAAPVSFTQHGSVVPSQQEARGYGYGVFEGIRLNYGRDPLATITRCEVGVV